MHITGLQRHDTNYNRATNFKNLARPYKRALLIVTDGVGISHNLETNPILYATLPFTKSALGNKNGMTLMTRVRAAETAVGLDKGEEGNSEAGHTSIGCGRKIKQTMVQIDEAIHNGTFFKNESFLSAINHAKANNSTLHIMGAVSNSHTHSKHEHIKALIDLAKSQGVEKVALHAFINGEGPTARAGQEYIKDLNNYLKSKGYSEIATVIGRNIAMNKSGNMGNIKSAYVALTSDNAGKTYENVEKKLSETFDIGLPGVDIPPIIRKGSDRIKDNDSVIFVNYRSDRARALTKALATDGSIFERPKNLKFICMTEYDETFNLPVAFHKHVDKDSIVEVLSNLGKKQVAIADKEKSSHVTYYLRGCNQNEFSGVKEIILPACTDVLKIRENTEQETEEIISSLEDDSNDFIVANYKAGDYIGHKGNFGLAIKAAEDLDRCIEKVVNKAIEKEVPVVIVSDHGNLEDSSTSKHTTNKVPCTVVLPNHKADINNNSVQIIQKGGNALQDIAPTILDIMGIKKPELMTGNSLILDING